MVGADDVKEIVGPGELAIRIEKRWISCDSLIQQIDRGQQNCLATFNACPQKKIFGAGVEIERGDVARWGTFNRLLFSWRKFYLQLFRNRLCDVALNGECVRELTIVSLPPEMPAVVRIDQLRVHAYTIGGPLNASSHHVGYAELAAYLAQIARDPTFVLHNARATDHFQIGDFCEIGQNFVLHAIGKMGALLVVTEILERQDGDTLFGD